jgi:acetylornithine/succinyldiaminopimelate/putrescine aminotransferase
MEITDGGVEKFSALLSRPKIVQLTKYGGISMGMEITNVTEIINSSSEEGKSRDTIIIIGDKDVIRIRPSLSIRVVNSDTVEIVDEPHQHSKDA